MNYFRTALLMSVMTALFAGIGYMLGGVGGMAIAFLFALGMNLFAYWNSDSMVLRMHNAQQVDQSSAPGFHRLVRELADKADLPMPKVYMIQEDQPNAFATGRNPENAAVAATTGLISMMSQEELAGVMAHELAHIKNRDTLIMTITATIAGAISMLANFAFFFGNNRDNPLGFAGIILMMIVAPFAAMLVQMAISRTREYSADAGGAEICGHPEWLAAALQKMERAAGQIDNRTAEANPGTAHVFIINPLHARSVDSLFSTHPNTANRVARLKAMAGGASTPRQAGRSRIPASGRGPWG